MSEQNDFIDVWPVESIPCPECSKPTFDYKRDDDPWFYCLNADCNTFKVAKQ